MYNDRESCLLEAMSDENRNFTLSNRKMTIVNLIINITVVITFCCWVNESWQSALESYPYKTYHFREWYRMFTSGFLHVDVAHLFFNMLALSSYLGHGHIRHTYWYLEHTPQLMRDIAGACEAFRKECQT